MKSGRCEGSPLYPLAPAGQGSTCIEARSPGGLTPNICSLTLLTAPHVQRPHSFFHHLLQNTTKYFNSQQSRCSLLGPHFQLPSFLPVLRRDRRTMEQLPGPFRSYPASCHLRTLALSRTRSGVQPARETYSRLALVLTQNQVI